MTNDGRLERSRSRTYGEVEADGARDADETRATERAERRAMRTRSMERRDEAMMTAMSGVFATACGVLRFGLPATGGLACWAAAAANSGEGLLGALGGALLVGTTLGVCAMIFAAMSATFSGVAMAWIMVRRWLKAAPGMRRSASRGSRSPPAGRPSRDYDGGNGDGRRGPNPGLDKSRSFSYGDWDPIVPVVDPRAPERLGSVRGEQVVRDPRQWGTHKRPADFRRENRDLERRSSIRRDEDDDSLGSSQWRSRAAYRQAEGFSDASLVGTAAAQAETAVWSNPHEEVIKKFTPKERLLPPTPPKPKHAHIPTATLIAMGGASLQSHIGHNGKDILSNARKNRASNVTRTGSASDTVVKGMFGFDVSVPEIPDRQQQSFANDGDDQAAAIARARFEHNLSSSFERPRRDFEAEFLNVVMQRDEIDEDEDDTMRSLRGTR